MLKRLLIIIFPLFLFAEESLAELQVFACEPELESLVQELGGELVTTYVATHAKQDVHHIQARPSLINRVRRADLVLCTGASLEVGWLPVLLQKGANPKVQKEPGLFLAANQVERLDVGQKADRSQGDVHPEGNPHVMLDPRKVLPIAELLTQRLGLLDPRHQETYQANFERFKQRWLNAITRWNELAKPLRGKPVVVHHQSWVYLLNWLGMELVATLEPLPGIPPSTSHLSKLIKQMAQAPAYTIIRSPFADKKGSQWLSKKTGICAIELPFTVGGNSDANDLFGLFDSTIALLINAKSCGGG
ncbi:MAG: zinc ABC transporter substrate-binding protein [Pseudomonadales bacterium]|nr:zinc ABC transporter substrate-binding protein [Pseudomonadales bacterium]